MDFIELKEGDTVRTGDGESIGHIDRFIVDPSTSKVTHLVLEKGILFPEDRVLPVDGIDHTDEEGPVLSTEVSPDSLPPFETTHYVEVDDLTRSRLDSRLGPAVMWRFPTLATSLYPMIPIHTDPEGTGAPRTEVRRGGIPGSSVVLDDDTPVMGINGEELGKVSDVFIDDDGRLSHLVVDLGLFSGDRILPAHWIESIRPDRVTVAVGDAALEGLEQDRGELA